MEIHQILVRSQFDNQAAYQPLAEFRPDLLLVFGSPEALQSGAPARAAATPQAQRLGCSTAGEITAEGVEDGCLAITALRFARSQVQAFSTELVDMADSHAAGMRLAQGLPREGLRAVLVFGQGVNINGSALLEGMGEVLGRHIPITGGLAGDGGAFVRTVVLDDTGVSSSRLSCVGLYGSSLVFNHGTGGGWSPFGPARKVTRSDANVLYELDGEPALQVYKRYLGEHAKELPAAGLLFPFAMLEGDDNRLGLTRTILGVDETNGSLTLAGDIDPNGYLKLMHASTDALVDGAEVAATVTRGMQSVADPKQHGLALLISCVGRKLVMGQRVDEEIEAVADIFGSATTLAGMYSYGEICPRGVDSSCKLHNQTMTITYLAEAA